MSQSSTIEILEDVSEVLGTVKKLYGSKYGQAALVLFLGDLSDVELKDLEQRILVEKTYRSGVDLGHERNRPGREL